MYEEPWTLPESIFDGLDDALKPDQIDESVVEVVSSNINKYFIDEGDPLGEWVPKEELVFIKFMIEDRDFFFKVYPLIDQNWFTLPEFRDIARTLKDMYRSGVDVTYPNLSVELLHHYDLSDITKEISWGIICELLEECQEDWCLEGFDIDWYKWYFVDRLVKFIPIPGNEW